MIKFSIFIWFEEINTRALSILMADDLIKDSDIYIRN